MIPRQILPDNILVEELSKLSRGLSNKGFQVATSLSSMFKLPIADCLFGSNEVRVTINIPVVKQSADYKIYKITTIPFQSNADQCVVHTDATAIVVTKGQIISVDNSFHEKCGLGVAKLCQVPLPYETRSLFTSCAESLLEGSETAIKEVI